MTAKRTRFSCWPAEEEFRLHLHHYDVVANDVTYWSTAATASRVPYLSFDACDLHRDNSQLRCWNDYKDDDDHRRRRTARDLFTGQPDTPTVDDSGSDEVFEDLTATRADWQDSGHHREVLRLMKAGAASYQRRQRVSQPLPPRHRPGGPRTGASNAATMLNERKPAFIRRTLTDLEAAEIAAGYPEVFYVGDTATVNAAESTRRHAADKKTQDSDSAAHGDDSQKTYDDEEGYYIHAPHDQIAYR